MKEKLMENLGYKILAVVLAIMVWGIVVNIEDPYTSTSFRNITVNILNEESIASLDKVYEIQSGGVINVRASARKSVLAKLRSDDIVAEADLSSLSLTNAVSIKLSCPRFENVILKPDVEMLKITLEDEATAQFKVDVNTVGTLSDGLALGDVVVRPNLIKVSGAQSLIDRISEVRVEVDVTNMTEDFKTRVEPKAYDANGKMMDATRLSFSSSEVRVSVGVNETKEIPVHVRTKGEPELGYHLISVEYEPKQIQVTGKEGVLSKISEIPITLDITGRKEDWETEISLLDYLPEGVGVVGDTSSINVKLTISRQEPQKIKIPLSSIEIRNLNKDMKLEYDIEEDYIEVTAIRNSTIGDSTILASECGAYIDCKELQNGKYELTVKFEHSDRIQILNEVKVKVKIQLKEENNVEETEKAIETVMPITTEEPLEPTGEPTEEPVETEVPIEEETEE